MESLRKHRWANEFSRAGGDYLLDLMPIVLSVLLFGAALKFSDRMVGVEVWLVGICLAAFVAGAWKAFTMPQLQPGFAAAIGFGIGLGSAGATATAFSDFGEVHLSFHLQVAYLFMCAYTAPAFMATLYKGTASLRPCRNSIAAQRLTLITLLFTFATTLGLPLVIIVFG